jgi:Adenylate kinase, active site lid
MLLSIDAADFACMYCNRQLHPRSGRVYVTSDNPPTVPGRDDITSERLVRLSDDRLHSVLLKMLQYQLTDRRVLRLYKQRKMVQSFTGARSDAVYANASAYLRSQLPYLAATARTRAPYQKQDDSYNNCSDWAYYSSDDSDDEYYNRSSSTTRRASADEQPLEQQPLQQQPFQERQFQEQFKTEEVLSEPGSDFWAKSSFSDGWLSRPPGSSAEIWEEPGSTFWSKTDSNMTANDSKASTRGTDESGDRAVERSSLFSWGMFNSSKSTDSTSASSDSRDDSRSSGSYRSSSYDSDHDSDSS